MPSYRALDTSKQGVVLAVPAVELPPGSCTTLRFKDTPAIGLSDKDHDADGNYSGTWIPYRYLKDHTYETYIVTRCIDCNPKNVEKKCKWFAIGLVKWKVNIDITLSDWERACKAGRSVNCNEWTYSIDRGKFISAEKLDCVEVPDLDRLCNRIVCIEKPEVETDCPKPLLRLPGGRKLW